MIGFEVAFDKPLTREEMIDLIETTIYGRRVNMVWTRGQDKKPLKDKYSPSESPLKARVPASTLGERLKDYGEAAGKVIQGLEAVKDAATYRRLNRILQKLNPAQWADFEKKITGKTTDLDAFEAAVDAYLAAQKEREKEAGEREEAVKKLHGLEAIYRKYKEWKRIQFQLLGWPPALLALTKSLNDDLRKNNFPGGIPEFEQFIQRYRNAFRTETVRIGLDLLAQYDSLLYKEAERYQDDAAVAAMHEKLAPVRKEFPEWEKSVQVYQHYERLKERSRLPSEGGTFGSAEEAAMAAAADAAKRHKAAAQQSVKDIAGEFPILKEENLPLERRLDKAAMAKADPAQLKALLQSHIQARRDDVRKSQQTLKTEPERVFSLDILLKLSIERQAVDPKSIFGEIVQDHVSDIKIKDAVIGFLVALFAIALTVLSFGTGAIAGAAAVGAFAVSAISAYHEFREYETKSAAAGAGLSSDDPSLVWVIVAVVGAALDFAQAAKAVGKIAPLAKGLEASGDVAKFAKGLEALEKSGEIDAKIARNVEQAAIARAKSAEAAKDLSKALGKVYGLPGPFTDPEVYKELVRLAFYKVREFGYAFEKFALEVQQARQAAKLGDLSTEELNKLKKAYDEGRSFASEGELLEYMKKTHPMGAVDPTAVPRGKRTLIDPADKDPENIRALGRENESADILSQKGYDVEQNPKVPGPSNPDYKLEGKVFDCYAPSEKKSVRGIWSYIKEEKLEKGQTTRVVLNLQDWGGDIAALRKQFHDWPMAGLDEILVIMKDKSVFHLVP
jgi:hypothetical protein